jgi:hypothetical protein
VVGAVALAWIMIGAAVLAGTTPSVGSIAHAVAAGEGRLGDGAVALIGVLLTAFAYSAGVIVDRIADTVLHPIESCVFDVKLGRSSDGRIRVRVLNDVAEPVAEFLAYRRTRVRIARGTVLNLFVLGFTVAAYLDASATVGSDYHALAILAYGLALAVMTVAMIRRAGDYAAKCAKVAGADRGTASSRP